MSLAPAEKALLLGVKEAYRKMSLKEMGKEIDKLFTEWNSARLTPFQKAALGMLIRVIEEKIEAQ